MTGKLYTVGVGPGDAELMTIKALKIIRSADCIACPESEANRGLPMELPKKRSQRSLQKSFCFWNSRCVRLI